MTLSGAETVKRTLPAPYGGVAGPVTNVPTALPVAANFQLCLSESRTTIVTLELADETEEELDDTELPEPLDTELPDPDDTDDPLPEETELPEPDETELPDPEETELPVPDESELESEEADDPVPLETLLASEERDEPEATWASAVGGQSGPTAKNADNTTALDVRRR